MGHGPDLVLLHGWGLHSGIWTELIPQLQIGRRVTCIDLPGHGMSPATANLCDLDAVCAQLREVMPHSVICVGWSMGGLIALAYATRYPASLQRLIMVASQPRFTRAPGWSDAMAANVLDEFDASLASNSRDAVERFLVLQVKGSDNRQRTLRRLREVLKAGDPDPLSLRAGLALLRDTDLRGEVRALTCPIRVILGERDVLVPVRSGRAIAGLLDDCRYAVISGAGHVPFLSHTPEFMHALEVFLDD
jgi:pimeloyl-[acyl-carrier protein] methyl ester esterase